MAPDSPLAMLLPLAYAVAAGIGIVIGLVVRRTNPDRYQRIGAGHRTIAAQPQPDPQAGWTPDPAVRGHGGGR